MYDMPKCTCGEELEFEHDDFFDSDGIVILYKAYGVCPKCKKHYQWKDVYLLTEFRNLEETE